MTSFLIIPNKPLTRNQRFLAAMARNHSKIKQGGVASCTKKYSKLKERAEIIREDADRNELLEWITEIQRTLRFSDREFASALGISIKMVKNYRAKVGYLPSKKTFRKLLELERLTRISVVVKKHRNYLVSARKGITVVIK